MNRHVAGILLVAAVCMAFLPTGCSAKPSAAEMAGALVDSMAKGDFAPASKDFNTAMKTALPADKLGKAWAQLTAQTGPFKSRGSGRETQESGYQAVYVTTEFEKTTIDIKMVFDKDGKIAGLWFLPHKVEQASSAEVASARALLSAIYDSNAATVENQSGALLQRESKNWVPATGKALRKQFGALRDISLQSSAIPASGWVERIWSVQAESKNYEMRASYLSDKLRHLEFRTASDQPWTPVTAIASGQEIK